MQNSSGLIPAKFLILTAHLTICVTLLWNVQESVKVCLHESSTLFHQTVHHALQNQLAVGLSVSIGLIGFELLVFLIGFTMFNSTSALISVSCHATASIYLTYLVFDGWQCGWFWTIFATCSIFPSLYDLCIDPNARPDGSWTKLLILAGISTTIGSALPVGYNIGVVNSPAEIIKTFCNESMYIRYGIIMTSSELEILWSAIVSIFLVGGTIGSLTGSWLAGKVGRKGGLIATTFLSIVAGVLFFATKLANSVEILLLGRLFVGLAAGSITCIMPMYLTELAPINLRGAMGVLCPLGITSGVLLAQIVSLQQVLGTVTMWPVLLSFYLIMVLLSTFTIPFLPESPKYLFVVRNQRKLALNVIEKLREAKIADLQEEIADLEVEFRDSQKKGVSIGYCDVLRDRGLLLPLLLVCSMQAVQQFSGINAVFYYSNSIFQNAGLSEQNSEYATVAAGTVNLSMAIISIYIMSRYNRRTAIQLSTSLSAAFLVLLGISITYMTTVSWMPYVSIIAVLSFVCAYGIGLGPIPYFIGSELFEVGPRPIAMALGSMANWGGNFIVGMTFPLMQLSIGPASFYIFGGITFMLFIFVRIYLPETKDCDPVDIARALQHGFKRHPPASPVSSSATDETFSADDLK